jgi:hypothetical protein
LTLAGDTRSVRQAAQTNGEVIHVLRQQLHFVAVLVVALATQAHADSIRVPADQPTIQQGIDVASEGDTVLVAPGTYTGPLNRGLDFGGVNICLVSEAGPDATVIDCEQVWRAAWLRSGEDASSLIQGFTICNGHGGSNGTGIWCQGASPTIRDCVFTGCHAWTAGGGLCVDSAASILLEDVAFMSNSSNGLGAGAYFSGGSTVVLRRCRFEGNHATPPAGGTGGGLACTGSTIELTDCVFISNSASYEGSGAQMLFSHVTLTRCSFVGNSHTPPYGTGRGGGLCLKRSEGQATDCTFIENKAYKGGGALVRSWSEPVSFSFVGCTFALCGSGIGAGIAVEGPAVAVLDRTIIAFSDYGDAVKCVGEGSFVLSCCDFYGSTGEDWPPCVADQLGVSGNISSDPLFCDLSALDLTLDAASPCAPAANPECGLIGAWEVGCWLTPVLPTTWGVIKAFYRDR